jgi:RNA polymerase sigma-70 factor (ECF subfamily)
MGDQTSVHNIRKSDEEVWQELKKGDKTALECIFHRYYADLYRYGIKFSGQRVLVEDEIQALFLKIWGNRQNLGDVTGVKTYLWTALRRRLIDKKKRDTHRESLLKKKLKEQEMQFSAEEVMIHREYQNYQSKALTEALNRLSEKHREVLFLKYYEGMSYEEIEHIMDINYQTARNYVYQGVKALREYLGENYTGLALAVMGISGIGYAIHLLLGLC